MRPLDAVRARLAHLPATVLHRSESAAARSAVIADVRAVFPELPRDASPEQLIRHARRLVRAAARDEFAREGVDLIDLPYDWGRAELREADIPADAGFGGFVEEVIAALVISPSPLERDDALELRDAPSSSDRYGHSLEAGADLASYLLSRAWMLMALEAVEAADGAGRPALPADTAPAPRDEQEFFEMQAQRMREETRESLERLVRVPLELRAAVDRHRRIEAARWSGESVGGHGAPARSRAEDRARRSEATSAAGGSAQRAREDITRRASAAFELARSEAGRTAFSMLRGGAERAYRAYGRRPGEAPGPGQPVDPGSPSDPPS